MAGERLGQLIKELLVNSDGDEDEDDVERSLPIVVHKLLRIM